VIAFIRASILPVISPFRLSLGSLRVQVQPFAVHFALVALVYLLCSLLILAIPARALQQRPGAGSDTIPNVVYRGGFEERGF